jgi:hypothetical protein
LVLYGYQEGNIHKLKIKIIATDLNSG